MIDVETTVEIAREPQEVFAFVADQTNAPQWQAGLTQVRRLTEGPPDVGSEHEFVRRFAGRQVASRNRFVEFQPGRYVEFEIPSGWLTGRASYLTEASPGGGTVLTSRMQFHSHGAVAPLEPLLQRLLARDSRADQDQLKQLLEPARSVPVEAPADPVMLRAAGACSWVLAVGFGLPCAYAIWYFAQNEEVWTFLGFPTYGHGPLAAMGTPTSTTLLVGFLLVCGVEFLDGWLLWKGRPSGSVLALVLLPFEFVFWWGFALPVGPLLGIARTLLVGAAWTRNRTAGL